MVVGPVVAGAIYDATKSYQTAFYMGGSVFLLSSVLMCFIPYALKKNLKKKSKAYDVREKKPKFSIQNHSKSQKYFSKEKPGALRKLAYQQSALRGKKTQKSKWDGEVQSHLRELNQIEEELHENNNLNKTLIA